MTRGQVVSLYSYKGGVGRTMALANVAWLLAANGRRVLIVDWDLEAPGLHRYFYPFLDDPSLEQTDGLLELLWDFVAAAQTPPAERIGSLAEPSQFADFSRVAVPVRFNFSGEGALHLVGAGRQDYSYADRLYKFEWQTFYSRFGGAAFIDQVISTAKDSYDFILVDSRTGVADTAGICTIQIPDQVVLFFTYNRQSVDGTAAVGEALRRVRPALPVLLRPTRVVRDVEGLTEARQFAHSMLGSFLPDLRADETEAYWQRVEIPHYAAYALEEVLAVLRDVAGGRNTLLSDMEVLTSDLLGGVPINAPRLDRGLRDRLLKQCRLRDPRQIALAEAVELEPSLAQRRLLELAAEARRRFRWDPDWIAEIAGHSSALAGKLAALGRHEEAYAATEEAVELYRFVARANADAFLPDLAMSLNNLGLRLSDLGRREEALAATEEALETYRRLAANRPDAFLPDLAMSLNNLGNTLSDLGRREEALAATEEAVEIRRRLAASRPDAFLPDLAGSLNNLGNRLSNLGRREETLAATEEALETYRRLAASRPDAFRPDLATSLNNLGSALSDLGRREEALAASQEAVAIRRQLAAARPDAFLPDLASSLGALSRILAALDRDADAAAASGEGLRLLAPLVERHPNAFGQLAHALATDLIKHSDAAHIEPDVALLTRIAAALGLDEPGS